MNITCDHCKETSEIEQKRERGKNGSEVRFFICPECNHRYDVCRISRKGLAVQRQSNGLRKMYKSKPRKALLTRIQRLSDQMPQHVTDLTKPQTPVSSSSS